jgi:hypothetical protein
MSGRTVDITEVWTAFDIVEANIDLGLIGKISQTKTNPLFCKIILKQINYFILSPRSIKIPIFYNLYITDDVSGKVKGLVQVFSDSVSFIILRYTTVSY